MSHYINLHFTYLLNNLLWKANFHRLLFAKFGNAVI